MMVEQIAGYRISAMVEFFRRHGLEQARIDGLVQRGNGYKRGVPEIPATYRRLFDDQRLRIGDHEWRTIVGHGHAPEHMSLYCAGARRADFRRHAAAAHLDQHLGDGQHALADPLGCSSPRSTASARCPPTRWCCRRTAAPSAACMPASTSCTPTTPNAARYCWMPAAARRRMAPT
jgi:hypothetical protein